jgi:hypothetical protein
MRVTKVSDQSAIIIDKADGIDFGFRIETSPVGCFRLPPINSDSIGMTAMSSILLLRSRKLMDFFSALDRLTISEISAIAMPVVGVSRSLQYVHNLAT